MRRARSISTRLVVALPLAFAAAGPITITASIVDAPPAIAWGLSDIGKAAKKVGGAVKGAAKSVAKDAKNSAQIVGRKAKKVGKGAASNARDFGGALKRDAKRIGSTVKGGAAAVARVAERGALRAFEEVGTRPSQGLNKLGSKLWGAEYDPENWKNVRRDFRDAYSRGKRKLRNIVTGNNKIGESLPRPDKSKAENALRNYMNRRGGITRKANRARGFKPGIVQDRKFRGGSNTVTLKPGIVRNNKGRGDYTGGYREVIGHDKSVWGRPVYDKKPSGGRRQVGNDKSVFGRPVYGKSRPSGGRHQIGNDKSVFGRPVYGKRPVKPGRKVQGIRLGDIKAGTKRTRDLRRKNGRFSKDKRFNRDRKRVTRDRKFKRDRKRLTRDRKFKRNKRVTRDRRFKRNNRKRFSREFRHNRKSRGFRMKRTRNRGHNRRRNNRRGR